MPLLRRIKWGNIVRLVIILFLASTSILSIFSFIKISIFLNRTEFQIAEDNSKFIKIEKLIEEKHRLSEERIGEVHKNFMSATKNLENSIKDIEEKHRLSEERIGEVHKNFMSATKNLENSIKDISIELDNRKHELNKFVEENDFHSVFIIGKKVGSYNNYREIKIINKESYKENYEKEGYHVIGEFKSLHGKD